MSGMPFFSRCSVLLSKMMTSLQTPILEFLGAYYAESRADVRSFCAEYGVDYMVVSMAEFSPEFFSRGQFTFDPYSDLVTQMVSERSHFVLPGLAEANSIFLSGGLAVITCENHVFK